ncbi:MAG: hypothetical protein WBG90_22140 [Saonia sp.]
MNTSLAIGIHINKGAVEKAYFIGSETNDLIASILKQVKPDQTGFPTSCTSPNPLKRNLV